MTTSDESLLLKLQQSLPSQKSYDNYLVRFNHLKIATGQQNIVDILLSPDTMYPKIQQKYPNHNTRKNMLVPLLTLFRINDEFNHHSALILWKTYFDEVVQLVNTDAKKNCIKEKQQDKYVSTEQVQLKRQEMKNDNPHRDIITSQQYLLLTLLSDITPKRSDLGKLRIYFAEDPVVNDENYIVLRKVNSSLDSFLVMNVYKTAKSYGRIEEVLSKETTQVIRDSLKKFPRNYLFITRFGTPHKSNASYGKFVERTFLELFGRAMGTSMWRHVYVTEKIDPNQSEEALEIIARNMCHSASVQRYERFADIAQSAFSNKN
jgi:hypothetical protein